MSVATVHTISLVLPAASYGEAGKRQASAKHWARHRLPDLLNRHLESLDNSDEVVYIEKVTIALNDLPWNLTDTAWQQMLAKAIQVRSASADSFALILRQWLFYLSNGCLETKSLLSSRQDIEDHLLQHTDMLPPLLLKEAEQAFSLIMWQRLLVQHKAALVTIILEILLDIHKEQAIKLYTVLMKTINEAPEAVFRLLSKLAAVNRAAGRPLKAEALKQLLSRGTGRSMEEDIVPARKAAGKYIACSNAGLVLLFPYIKRFFENTGLVQGDTFINDMARMNAVQSLHWLATGKEAFPQEELLALPKLLCGMELSDSVEWDDVLPAAIQTGGSELLQAVIGHWKTLQHTSIDGLRETFLQRNGKLLLQEDSCTLQVEESGVDILLNSIPWGFRNYRLPWMRCHLITEWY
ncbi:MAG: hypothetical protein KF862_25700 [Chitinophagaceae bacterium]|nr:hypothetical protein [Chitinophagaceae bacterium]